MLDKIIFLCVNPWEGLLPPVCQSCGKEYFQWFCQQARLKKIKIEYRETVEIYGELQHTVSNQLFSERENIIQLLYVQTNREELLKKVFEQADLVIMGIPGSRKAFDQIYMSVFPWKDQIMFLWDKQIYKNESYFNQLCREYKINEAQIIEIERGFNGMIKK